MPARSSARPPEARSRHGFTFIPVRHGPLPDRDTHSKQGDLRHLLSAAAAVGTGVIAGEITGSAVRGVFWALLAGYVVMTLAAATSPAPSRTPSSPPR